MPSCRESNVKLRFKLSFIRGHTVCKSTFDKAESLQCASLNKSRGGEYIARGGRGWRGWGDVNSMVERGEGRG